MTTGRFRAPESVNCSFCSKRGDQVGKLVSGPGVFICNECVEMCVEIFEHEGVDWRMRT